MHGEVAFVAEHRVSSEAHVRGGATGAQRERGHAHPLGHPEHREQVSVGDEARDGVPGVLVLLQDGGEFVSEVGLARSAERDDARLNVLDGDGGRPGNAVGYGHEVVVRVAR